MKLPALQLATVNTVLPHSPNPTTPTPVTPIRQSSTSGRVTSESISELDDTGIYVANAEGDLRAFANGSPKQRTQPREKSQVDLVLPPVLAFSEPAMPKSVTWVQVFELIKRPELVWPVWKPSKTVNEYTLREQWSCWTVGESVFDTNGIRTAIKPPLREVELYFGTASGQETAGATTKKRKLLSSAAKLATNATEDTFMLYRQQDLEQTLRLSQGGILLYALLAGGDYSDGIDGCGAEFAKGIAQTTLGGELLDASRNLQDADLDLFLEGWRSRLKEEFLTNNSGFLPSRSPSLARKINGDFPDKDVLDLYTRPLTSWSEGDGAYVVESAGLWFPREPVPSNLVNLCSQYFGWDEEIKFKFRQNFACNGNGAKRKVQGGFDAMWGTGKTRQARLTASAENFVELMGAAFTPSKDDIVSVWLPVTLVPALNILPVTSVPIPRKVRRNLCASATKNVKKKNTKVYALHGRNADSEAGPSSQHGMPWAPVSHASQILHLLYAESTLRASHEPSDNTEGFEIINLTTDSD
ncbi:hypothetical protein D9613_011519 [Agrocybe pediades]|uniref:Uncharacterized protein n=1 Tax=Agrocybe pediades TaxID=84607 RepID=A0A8H4VQC1_9AGAR|nr:hypothetical protein D9613_011519 [Agrocybe pediades]